MTNYDKLIEMSVEEFSEEMQLTGGCPSEYGFTRYPCLLNKENSDCKKCWMEWLNKEYSKLIMR